VGVPAWADDDDAGEPEVTEETEVEGERGKPKTDTHRHPSSVVVVELDESIPPSATLADVLDDVAGLHLRRFGGPGDPSFVTVRGSTSRQVEVWVDGVPLNAHGGAAVDLSRIPLDGYDSVEVFRGFAPPRLGSSAIGGVVHLRSRPGSTTPARFEAGFGSWRTRHVSATFGAGQQLSGGAVGDVRLSASYDGTAGDYPYFWDGGTLTNLLDDRTRERANNHHDGLATVTTARLWTGPLKLTLTDQLSWSDGGVPGVRPKINETARLGELHNLLAGTALLDVSPALELRGELSWQLRRVAFTDLDNEIGLAAQDRRDLQHQPVIGLHAAWRALPWLGVLGSVRTVIDVYEPIDLLTSVPHDGVRLRFATTLSIGAELEPFDGLLAVTPLVSVHLLDNRFLGEVPFQGLPIVGDGEQFIAAPTAGVAVAVRPLPWLTIRAAAAHAYRAPYFEELFGDKGGIAGNPRLRPETANSLDVSARVGGDPHRHFSGGAEVGYYRSDARDRIVFRPSGQRVSIPVNFDGSTIHGFEVAGRLRLLDVITASGAVTYADSEITVGEGAHVGNRLPHVPLWEVDVAAGVVVREWLRAEWRFRYTAGTFDSRTNLFEQAPRPLHSLYVRLSPGRGWPWASLEIQNLGDVTTFARFRDPLHPADDDRVVVVMEDFRGNPLPGRSFMVSVGWTADLRRQN